MTWLVRFQFDGTKDFFHIDIADYAPALGSKGPGALSRQAADIEAGHAPELTDEQERALFENRFADRAGWHQLAEGRHTRCTLEYNAQRLAVVDRDAQAVIRAASRNEVIPCRHSTSAYAMTATLLFGASRFRCVLFRHISSTSVIRSID